MILEVKFGDDPLNNYLILNKLMLADFQISLEIYYALIIRSIGGKGGGRKGCRKGVIRNFVKFTGKHQYQSFFFKNVTG